MRMSDLILLTADQIEKWQWDIASKSAIQFERMAHALQRRAMLSSALRQRILTTRNLRPVQHY